MEGKLIYTLGCPFCGEHLVREEKSYTLLGIQDIKHPVNDCLLSGIALIRQEMIDKWNKRYPIFSLPPNEEEIELASKRLDFLRIMK